MKKDKRKIEGITLIALVITIIVLLILAGVTIAGLSGENGILARAKEAKRKTTEANQQENLMLQEIEGIMSDNFDGTSGGNFNDSKKVNAPRISQGMIPIKFNGKNWVICSESDTEWYNYDTKKWANIMLSDGTYKDKSQVGQVVEDKDLGSMFVWIPRYAYSINKYKTPVGGDGNGLEGEGTSQNITKVVFLQGRTNSDGVTEYPTDYNQASVLPGKPTPMIVHPAFTFGDSQLPGIWSAKFEASMAEVNNNTINNNNVNNKTIKVLPNKNTWRYICIGNVFDNCLNMRNNAIYGLSADIDSHLMKNNEWGAVSYFTVSQYGVTPTFNSKCDKINVPNGLDWEGYSEYSAGSNVSGEYKINITQSSTGNETGIYDLNGGAWEYVAAYWDNENGNLSGQGTNKFFTLNKLKSGFAKYWDKYEVSQEEIKCNKDGLWNADKSRNQDRMNITKARYDKMANIKGDGMYEVINTYSYYGKNDKNEYNWGISKEYKDSEHGRTFYNSDCCLFGHCNLPFLFRGGSWWYGIGSGLFASNGYYGYAAATAAFRPVLVLF